MKNKRLLLLSAAIGALMAPGLVHAQNAKAVTVCAAQTYTAGQSYPTTQTLGGVFCDTGGGGGGNTTIGNVTITGPIGQTTKSASVAVTVASDQGALGSVVISSGNVTATPPANITVQVTNTPAVTVTSGAITETNSAAILSGISGLNANVTATATVQGCSTGTPFTTAVPAVASGGATPFHLLSSAGNNTTEVSAGAHTLYSLTITGTNTAVGDVRLYDTGTAPNCASATGVVSNWQVITTTGLEGGLVVPIPAQGILFASGLAYCITGAVADNDNTNAPTGININGAFK